MPVAEKIVFLGAPIQIRDTMVVEAAVKMAKSVSVGRSLSIDEAIKLPESKVVEKDREGSLLRQLESSHRIIMLYLWLR